MTQSPKSDVRPVFLAFPLRIDYDESRDNWTISSRMDQ